ncbi:glycosyltransferase [bacterium]|nr:glycosyltransferase [bacterium]
MTLEVDSQETRELAAPSSSAGKNGTSSRERARACFRPSVLVVSRAGDAGAALASALAGSGARVLRLRPRSARPPVGAGGTGESFVSSLAFSLAAAWRLVELRREVDVVHVEKASLLGLALLAPIARFLGLPLLAVLEETASRRGESPRLLERIVSLARGHVASPHEAEPSRCRDIYERLLARRPIVRESGNGRSLPLAISRENESPTREPERAELDVSYVVPVFDAADTLARSVACIVQQKTARTFEVVIVDDGSRDGSARVAAELARKHEGKVRVLEKENGGEASALNLGFAAARGAFIAIVEADVELDPGWLDECASVLEREPGAIAAGGYLETPREDPWIARLAGYEIERKFATKPRDAKHLTSANVLYRREAWRLAGPFDERLRNASLDSVFNGRLVRAGKRLVYEPRARCRHHYKTTFPAYLRRQFAYARFRVHNEVLDLYPADRWLAVHVALSALAAAVLAVEIVALPFLRGSLFAACAASGPIALGLALAIEVPAALAILARTHDPAALLYPPVVFVRNVVGAVGYALGLLLETRARPRRVETSERPRECARVPRVLVVAPLYHTDRGGLGRQAVLLTEKLASLGVRAEVATRNMRGLPRREFSPRVKVHRVPAPRPGVHNYEAPNLENFLTSLAFSLGLVLLVIRRRREIDLIHVHGASLPLLLVLPVAKLLGIPVLAKVAAAHQGLEAGDVRRRYGPLGGALAFLFARADGYVATTGEIARMLAKDGVAPSRIARVPNFVDVEAFAPLSPEARAIARRELLLEGRVALVASGRLSERKAGDVLVRAFARARSGTSETPSLLVFLGDGPERPKLEGLARSLGIEESVRFAGFVGDVPRRLGAADVLVLASRIEGFPNALLEGLSTGLACVATRIGGGEEAIRDGSTGLLVPPDDEASLASALARLIRDEDLRRSLGEAAARDVRSRFALEAVAPRYLSIYRGLLSPEERE